MTEWRDIPGYPGYRVSSDGRVRGKRFPDRDLRPSANGNSTHLHVALFGPNGRREMRVHAAVALAFIGPKPDWAECIRHLNDVPTDNRVENLAYGTMRDNALDAVRNGVHNNTRKTHCSKGHPFDEANTLRLGRRRQCAICAEERRIAYMEARRKPPRPPFKHGLRSSYNYRGCRCDECRAAVVDYKRARLQAKRIEHLARMAELGDRAERRKHA